MQNWGKQRVGRGEWGGESGEWGGGERGWGGVKWGSKDSRG